MKKKLILLAMTVIMAMTSLTGCVTTQQEAQSAGADASSEEENVLNVYTALEDEQVTDYLEEFKELHPDVTVNVTRESTGVITSRLLAEKDNPVADVVWGLSATSLLVLKQEGMLEPYAPEGVDRILPQFKDTDETPSWVGIDAWETAWIVNKEVLKSHRDRHRSDFLSGSSGSEV